MMYSMLLWLLWEEYLIKTKGTPDLEPQSSNFVRHNFVPKTMSTFLMPKSRWFVCISTSSASLSWWLL